MTRRPRRVARAGGWSGFTLVELLVGLVLLGMLSVLLYGGLRFGPRAWESASQRIERVNEVEVTQTLVRRELARARLFPLIGPEAGTGRTTAFAGGRERVTFVAPMAPRLGLGGFYVLSLGFETRGADGRLVLRWRPFRADERFGEAQDAADDGGSVSVLLSGVDGVEIAYFGASDRGGEAEWHDEWTEAVELPSLVRIRLAFAEPGRRWPELVVALRTRGLWN